MRRNRTNRILAATLGVGLLLLIPASVSAGSRAGTWLGSTSQDQNVRFKVADDQSLHSFKITVTVHGAACDIDIALVAKGLETPVKHDSFSVTAHEGSSTVVVNGTFSSLRHATGTARMVENNGECGDGTGHADWKATRQ
jgi:hypothetical protein